MECCTHCYLARMVAKNLAIGLTIGLVGVMGIIGVLTVVGAI